jgi:hypothetical protein
VAGLTVALVRVVALVVLVITQRLGSRADRQDAGDDEE